MALRYKCGAEFLPSPLASKAEYALTAQHPLICKGHMTAVAVAVEKGHAVAFLGTATGEVTTPPTPSWLFVFLFSFSAFIHSFFFCFPPFCPRLKGEQEFPVLIIVGSNGHSFLSADAAT